MNLAVRTYLNPSDNRKLLLLSGCVLIVSIAKCVLDIRYIYFLCISTRTILLQDNMLKNNFE